MSIHILSPSDPQRTLDRVMATHRDPGTEVVLRAGEYLTGGAWAAGQNWERLQAPGVLLRAEGGEVRVRLAPDAPRSLDGKARPERDLRVWTYGHNAQIRGITFDGAQASFPNHYVTAGVRGVGSSEFEDVWAEGLRGVYPSQGQAGIEAFGISSTGPEGGSRWTRCGVRNCAENAYVSAFNVGHLRAGNGTPLARSELLDCVADPGAGNWMGFGINEDVDLINPTSRRVVTHVYNDTESTRGICVQGGSATDVQKIVSLVSVDGHRKVQVRFIGGQFALVGDKSGVARVTELWDQSASGAEIGDVCFLECRIQSSALDTHLAAVAGKPTTVHRPVVFVRCELPASHRPPTHPSVALVQCR